jgi:hypothetical protein
MSYPNTIASFTTKINKNASGYYVGPEYFNVPSTSPYELYLDHVPTDTKARSVGASGGATWTEVLVAPVAVSTYLVDYVYGKVTFYSGNAGAAAQAIYYSLGDDIMAEHMNEVQTESVNIETTLGASPAGSYATVAQRLNAADAAIVASGINGQRITDDTVRAGALMDDIKGAGWSLTRDTLVEIGQHKNVVTNAHMATAISVTPPGISSITTVQGHVSAAGSTVISNNNPHGMTFDDLSGTNIDLAGFVQAHSYVVSQVVSASGTAMYINSNGPDRSSALCFFDNNLPDGQRFGWNHNSGRFELTTNVELFGTVTASGSIKPEASGIANADVGTIGIPFASGNFVTVQAVSYKTGDSTGANGNFTTSDSKKVVVKNGLIVSIV